MTLKFIFEFDLMQVELQTTRCLRHKFYNLIVGCLSDKNKANLCSEVKDDFWKFSSWHDALEFSRNDHVIHDLGKLPKIQHCTVAITVKGTSE